MECVDDLALISEKTLYLSANISPEKIRAIFSCGKEVIDAVNEKYRVDIEDVEKMREDQEWRKGQDMERTCAVEGHERTSYSD